MIQLAFEDLGVRHVADGNENTGAIESAFLAGFIIFQPNTSDLVLVLTQNLSNLRIPDRLDLVIGEGAFGHNLGGPEFIAAMNEVYFAGKPRQIGRLLAG